MEVKELTIYNLNGKEYRSIDEIKNEIYNQIGKNVIDTMKPYLPPKTALALMEHLTKKEVRAVLTTWLNVEIEGEYEMHNVLDL